MPLWISFLPPVFGIVGFVGVGAAVGATGATARTPCSGPGPTPRVAWVPPGRHRRSMNRRELTAMKHTDLRTESQGRQS
ncbi:hypothetical protein BX281_2718 [Streptomyces sp. Ag82_O1-15]|jgi:hypothetical protein|nr:hypothetical protein BX281_2718 [Streptomyces sp. Ag82_O1-15]